jgi:hypothetical protein
MDIIKLNEGASICKSNRCGGWARELVAYRHLSLSRHHVPRCIQSAVAGLARKDVDGGFLEACLRATCVLEIFQYQW